ncbi:MAG: hypothetical protein ACJAS4_003478 [Bacteriovoracaceae bacterium]|jgi:hypothetical protein
MTFKTPEVPENSFRVIIEVEDREPRLDTILFEALKAQNENDDLKNISKIQLKKLFTEKKVLIKGQSAKAKSGINAGKTFVDILL